MFCWSARNMTRLREKKGVSCTAQPKVDRRRDGSPVDSESPSTGGRKAVLETASKGRRGKGQREAATMHDRGQAYASI